MTTLIADTEANGFLQDATKIWTLAVAESTGDVTCYTDYDRKYPSLGEGLQRLRDADRVVFHNAFGYDYFLLEKLHPGTLRLGQVEDTLVFSRFLDPEEKHNKLEDWGHRLGVPKMEWTHGFDAYHPLMPDYNIQDVKVSQKHWAYLQSKMKPEWRPGLELEYQVAYIIELQRQHGFRLDVDKAQALASELRQERNDIESSLQALFPPRYVPAGDWDYSKKVWKPKLTTPKVGSVYTKSGAIDKRPYIAGSPYVPVYLETFSPSSRRQIAQRLSQSHGWKPTKYTMGGQPQVDDAVLAELNYPEAKELARSFRLDKQLGMVADGDAAWLKLVGPDGYVHGSVNTIGAQTHRMSHFAPNMGQVDKKDLRMREVWLPDPGEVLVGCDADGLELRCLAHYLARFDGGVYANAIIQGRKEDKTDNHSLTQQIAKLHKRDNAKRLIYALLYGAGDKKLGLIIYDDYDEAGVPRPKKSPSALGKEVRAALLSGIKGLGTLTKEVKTVAKRGWLRGIDDRPVPVRYEHAALNTLLQSAGAIIMKKALVIFHFELLDVPVHYCANVHDEVQMSVAPEHAEHVGKLFAQSITLAGERLNFRCPLKGTYDIGNNWKDTH